MLLRKLFLLTSITLGLLRQKHLAQGYAKRQRIPDAALVTTLALGGVGFAVPARAQISENVVREIRLDWPNRKPAMPMMAPMGSTHEISWNAPSGKVVWVTGQNYDSIARLTLDGNVTYFPLPKGSGPHGMAFDKQGRLWVTLEFSGKVVRLEENGTIAQEIDVRLHATGAKTPINTHPHGLAIGSDGETLWFTGKKTGTVGRIMPDGTVAHFELPTVGSVPIYLALGPDRNMWCTELVGGKIARVTPEGVVTEFTPPTPNSRPIALVPAPDNKSLWFTEEAGSNVARIEMSGAITEYPLPRPRQGSLLGGLCFDGTGGLWVECYDVNRDTDTGAVVRVVSAEGGGTAGGGSPDYLARFAVPESDKVSNVAVTYHTVPFRQSVLHRIIIGPDRNLWFTEMSGDRVGIVPRATWEARKP